MNFHLIVAILALSIFLLIIKSDLKVDKGKQQKKAFVFSTAFIGLSYIVRSYLLKKSAKKVIENDLPDSSSYDLSASFPVL